MSNDFKNLVELQDVDLKIIDLEKSKEEFPIKVETLENEIKEAKGQLETREEELNQLLTEQKKIEEQIVTSKSSLDKSQERLNTIKTNKEYDAVHTEIETQKNLLNTGEKRLKKISQEIETLQSDIEEKRTTAEEVTTKNQPEIDELKTKIAGIDSVIAEVNKDREKIAAEANKFYLRSYNHIRSNRKSGSVISVVVSSSRNCDVCYQMIDPQAINEMRKGSNLVYCQNCGSILIWEPRTRQ